MLPYAKLTASASSMHEPGHPESVLWQSPVGQRGEGGREEEDSGLRGSTYTGG